MGGAKNQDRAVVRGRGEVPDRWRNSDIVWRTIFSPYGICCNKLGGQLTHCSQQIALVNSVCSTSTPPDSSAICIKNDTSTLAARTCCGYCTCGLGTEAPDYHGLTRYRSEY